MKFVGLPPMLLTVHDWNRRHSEFVVLIAILLAAFQALALRHRTPRVFRWLSRAPSPTFNGIFAVAALIVGIGALVGLLVGSCLGAATSGLIYGIYGAAVVNAALSVVR